MSRLDDSMLIELTEAAGVSGAEDDVRKLILKAIQDHVDGIRIDALGNIIATKSGTGEFDMRVLVAAHMDEVGFMISSINSDGTLSIRAVGGIDDRILPALRVEVGKKRIPGVIPWKPIHLSRDQKVQSISSMRIDIGADSKSAAEGKVKIGDRAVFAAKTIELSDTIIRGKAFDDRAGCAELIALLKGDPYPFDLVAAFTVQEEVGLRGAKVLGESIRPDAAIILETTACHELPQDEDEPDQTTVTKLGHGPVLYLMDRSAIAHPGLLRHFEATAEKYDIAFQYRSPQFAGGTDGGAIHVSLSGIPTMVMSLPCRYIHSPYSILSLDDFEHGIQLARHALMDLTPDNLER